MPLRSNRPRPAALRRAALASLWLAALAPAAASAQPSPAAPSPTQPSPAQPSPAAPAADPKLDEARMHYDRGLKLFDDGAYDGARVEFQKAYQLAPSYKIHYNLGLVHRQSLDFASAIRSFERYLSEGGSAVGSERIQEVTKSLQELRNRVGRVRVQTNVAGAEIFVDDVSVGHTPLDAPIVVNAGNRKISASKTGRIPVARVVQVASSESLDLSLDLPEGRTVIMVDRPTRRVPWVGWGATGALAVGAGVLSYLAWSESSDLKDARNARDASADDLDKRESRTQTYSIIADVCTVGAIVAGGASLYYTLKWGREAPSAPAAPPPVSLNLGPRGFGLSGSF